MEATAAMCWILLLLLRRPADAEEVSTPQTYMSTMQTQTWSATSDADLPSQREAPEQSANVTCGEGLMDTEMGLVAVGSAGGLILCLLAATVVLACQVCALQRRSYTAPRSRSGTDLISSTLYWDPSEVQGLVGPCNDDDAAVALQEVRAQVEQEVEGEEKIKVSADPQNTTPQTQSTVSCSEVLRDLEDTPLVV